MKVIIKVVDVDGGWSNWIDTVDERLNCSKKVRECNNPIQCDQGKDCIGESVMWGSDCPGTNV